MRQRNGPVYTGRLVGDDDDRTMANSEVTTGLALTPAYGFIAQTMRPAVADPPRRWTDDARQMFTVIGMVAAVAILLGAGLYLVVSVACPCTFGATSDPATPVVTVNASDNYGACEVTP